MNSLREWEEAFEQAVDVKKSYDLAKRMEEPKTNPVLGYRTAGSKAEWETGELLLKEELGTTEDKLEAFKRNAGNGPSECSEGQDQGGQLGLSSRSPSLP